MLSPNLVKSRSHKTWSDSTYLKFDRCLRSADGEVSVNIRAKHSFLSPISQLLDFTGFGGKTRICVDSLTNNGSDNGWSSGRRQAIIWTSAGILLIGPFGTNSIGIWIGIQVFSFKEMHSNKSYAKWRPFCLGLNVLTKTLNVRGPSYLGLTMSISWLLMPWLLTSPGHQHPWYWLCRIGGFLSYLRMDFKYLRVSMWRNDTKCIYIFVFPLKNLARNVLMNSGPGAKATPNICWR